MFPVLALEKHVLLDFLHTVGTYPQFAVTAEPLDDLSRLVGDGHFWREDERLGPVHHLAVGFLGVLRAEGRVA